MHTKNLELHRALNKGAVFFESGMFLTGDPAGVGIFDLFQCWYQLTYKTETVK